MTFSINYTQHNNTVSSVINYAEFWYAESHDLYAEFRYVEIHDLFIVMLNVTFISVAMLNFIMLSVVVLNVVAPILESSRTSQIIKTQSKRISKSRA
jgi:hypothetical protein